MKKIYTQAGTSVVNVADLHKFDGDESIATILFRSKLYDWLRDTDGDYHTPGELSIISARSKRSAGFETKPILGSSPSSLNISHSQAIIVWRNHTTHIENPYNN